MASADEAFLPSARPAYSSTRAACTAEPVRSISTTLSASSSTYVTIRPTATAPPLICATYERAAALNCPSILIVPEAVTSMRLMPAYASVRLNTSSTCGVTATAPPVILAAKLSASVVMSFWMVTLPAVTPPFAAGSLPAGVPGAAPMYVRTVGSRMTTATDAPTATAPPVTPTVKARALLSPCERRLISGAAALFTRPTVTPCAMKVSTRLRLSATATPALTATAPPAMPAAATETEPSARVSSATASASTMLPPPSMLARVVPSYVTAAALALTPTNPPPRASVAAAMCSYSLCAAMVSVPACSTLPPTVAMAFVPSVTTATATPTPAVPPKAPLTEIAWMVRSLISKSPFSSSFRNSLAALSCSLSSPPVRAGEPA